MTILELIGIPYFKKGSGIHIKKKNRGKFTEYCGGKVTDECIQKAKKSKNPTLRKRATFALNARGWSKKHLSGGLINKYLKGTPKNGIMYNVPLEERPVQKLPQEAKKMADWLDVWNQKAYSTGKFEDLLGDGEMEKQAARRRTVIFTDSPIDFGHNYARNTWKGESYKDPEFRETYYPKTRDFAKSAASTPGVLGLYSPEAHVAYATSYAPHDDDAQREELTHASQASTQESKIKEIIGTPKDPYLDDASEIYYRIMQYRKDKQMDPTKRDYTVKDIENMRKPFEVEKFHLYGIPRKDGKGLTLYSTEVEDKNYELFNRYTPEQLMRIFNEVADSGIKLNHLYNALFARKGKKLISKNL